MRLFVIGFPKSGTTTLNTALEIAGLKTLHWRLGNEFIGKLIYDSFTAGRDPLERFASYDAITQSDVCVVRSWRNRFRVQANFWPNLDFSVLAAIRRHHPDCWMVLNYRDPAKVQQSLARWFGFQQRIAKLDVPGLPAGYGHKDDEILNWIKNHQAACRTFFANDARFLEYDIESAAAAACLTESLGIDLPWWGKANVGAEVHGKA